MGRWMIDIRLRLLDFLAASPLKVRSDWHKTWQPSPINPFSGRGKRSTMPRKPRPTATCQPRPFRHPFPGAIQSP